MKKYVFMIFLFLSTIILLLDCKKDRNKEEHNDPSNVAKADLIAYFPFDGTGKEYINNILPGVKTDQVKFVPGQRGKAYQGDSLAFIIYNLSPSFELTSLSAFTFSLWIKAPGISNSTPPIPLFLQINGTDDPVWGNLAFGQERSNADSLNFHFYFYDDDASVWKAQHLVYSNPFFTPLQWIYLTISYDSATSKLKLYVKGQRLILPEEITNRTTDDPNNGGKPLGRLVFKNATQMVIGTWWYLATGGASVQNKNPWMGYFKGQLDELRIYRRALTDAEVLQLYNEEVLSLSPGA